MIKIDFSKALGISRGFLERTEEDEQYLYECIQIAVSIVQDGSNDPLVEKALNFLVDVYTPLIKKISKIVFRMSLRMVDEGRVEFTYSDVLQETYATFLVLLRQYDPKISSFSYYINKTLLKRMKYWVNKEMRKLSCIQQIDSSRCIDPRMESNKSVDSYLSSYVLINDYIKFMEEKEKTLIPRSTAALVCGDFFLGKKTCSEIAKERNISYHAVYDMINKYKKYVIKFFNSHILFDGVLTSTGEISW